MKKAVIASGGKQYLVSEGESLEVELINSDKKTVEFMPLMILDGASAKIGTPDVKGAKVSATIEGESKNDKVTSIRYKAKKRVHKRRGHRQTKNLIKIKSITP